jgi:hypothetical protein
LGINLDGGITHFGCQDQGAFAGIDSALMISFLREISAAVREDMR